MPFWEDGTTDCNVFYRRFCYDFLFLVPTKTAQYCGFTLLHEIFWEKPEYKMLQKIHFKINLAKIFKLFSLSLFIIISIQGRAECEMWYRCPRLTAKLKFRTLICLEIRN